MNSSFTFFAISVPLIPTICIAGSMSVDIMPIEGSPPAQEYLQYDDGTPEQVFWWGIGRGVWFNTDDFVPGMSGFLLDFTEYWFYHHSSYPWDTCDFYAEVWNGDYITPSECLNSTLTTAVHFGPTFVYYDPPLDAESNFWAIENTCMSSGGWPSILGDDTPPTVNHSYYTDDFFVWEPWNNGDYLIRCGGEFSSDLENYTWAGIKATF